MAEPLETQLDVDISAALSAFQQLDQALAEVVANFSAGLTAAVAELSQASLSVDTSQLTTDVQDALAAISTPVAIDADVTALESGIAAATEPQTIPIEGDTEALDAEIAAAVEPVALVVEGDTAGLTEAVEALVAEPTVIPLDGDTSAVQGALDAIEAQPIEVPVEVDTEGAQESINALGASSEEAAGGVESLTGGAEALSIGAGIASGHTGELATGIASIGQKSAGAVAGVVALSGFIGEVTSLASDAEAQTRRFDQTFGDLAKQVRSFDAFSDVADDIADLGIKSGTTNADLEATASRIGGLGRSSGQSDAAIVGTTEKLLALGATVAVNNPRLGDAAEVTDRLTTALAKGDKALVPFGLNISKADILERARIETGKQDNAQLTLFEKAQAGATLAVQQFGGALGDDFAAGADNAQIKLRSLKVQLEETLVGIGGPLLQPLTDSLEDLLPVAQSVGEVLGSVAGAVVPAFSALAPVLAAVAVPLHAVADILDQIPQPAINVALALGVAAAGSVKLAQAAVLLRTAGFIGLGDTLATIAAKLGLYTVATGTATAATEAQTIAFTAEGFAAQKAAASTATAAAGTGALTAGLLTAGAALGAVTIALGNAKIQERARDFSLLEKGALATGISLFSVVPGMNAVSGVLGNFIPKAKEATVDLSGLSAQIEAVGSSRTAGLGDLAAQVDDLAKHFSSGSDQAKAFNDSFIALAQSGKTDEASRALGLVTIELEKQGKSASEIGALFRPYFDSLEVTAALNKVAQKDVAAAGITAAAASGGWQQLADAIAAGTPVTEDAAAIAATLGVAEEDVTAVIEHQLDAITAQNDKRIEASAAALQLRSELEAGNVTAAQAEIGFLQLGVSLGGTKDLLDDVAESAKANAEALIEQRDAQILASDAAERLRSQLAHGAITAEEAETRYRALGLSLDSTTQEIDDTTKAVEALVSKGLAGLPESADAINDWQQSASDAFKQLADDATNETGSIKDDLAALNLAADPAVVVDNIIAQFQKVQAFSDNLLALVADFPNAVRALISDPNKSAAAALAASLVNDRETAAAFDLSIAVADAKTDELNARLQGPIADKLGEGGIVVGKAIFGPPGGVAEGIEPQSALEKILAAISGMETPLQSATRRLAEGGAAAFNPDLATPAQRAAGEAASHISRADQLTRAAKNAGAKTTDEFGKNIDLSAKTAQALSAAGLTISDETFVISSAGVLGVETGNAFATGLANGLTSATNTDKVRAAASALAAVIPARIRTILGIASPSKVGIEIGGEFVEGVVVGLGNTTNLATSGARLATTISTSTAGALSAVGPQIVSNIVAGFNDPATIAAGIARLQELVAQATAQSSASLSSFVTSASGALPTAGSDISSFSQRVTSALGEQTSALDAYHKASHDVAVDRQNLAQLLERERTATVRLHQAVRAAFEDVAARKPQSTIDTDVAAVQAAQRNIAGIQSALGSARREAASDAGTLGSTANAFRAARDALTVASDPARFIENLNRQTRAAQAFQADVARLAQGGFTDLAEQLAQAGPETAGKLADALANRPARARQAEAAIDAASAFADSYQQFLENQFAPQVTATAAKIGAAAGAALSSGISINGIPTSFATSQNVTVTAAGGVPVVPVRQVIELDLDISLPDGTTLTAQKTIEAPTGQAVTRLRAAVKAKVNA